MTQVSLFFFLVSLSVLRHENNWCLSPDRVINTALVSFIYGFNLLVDESFAKKEKKAGSGDCPNNETKKQRTERARVLH